MVKHVINIFENIYITLTKKTYKQIYEFVFTVARISTELWLTEIPVFEIFR